MLLSPTSSFNSVASKSTVTSSSSASPQTTSRRYAALRVDLPRVGRSWSNWRMMIRSLSERCFSISTISHSIRESRKISTHTSASSALPTSTCCLRSPSRHWTASIRTSTVQKPATGSRRTLLASLRLSSFSQVTETRMTTSVLSLLKSQRHMPMTSSWSRNFDNCWRKKGTRICWTLWWTWLRSDRSTDSLAHKRKKSVSLQSAIGAISYGNGRQVTDAPVAWDLPGPPLHWVHGGERAKRLFLHEQASV